MILAGDEVGNSQSGNNNAYCQDNEIGWIDWSGRNVAGQDLTDFIARLIALRRGCSLSHDHFLEGKIRNPTGRKDIAWYRADGQEMTEPDWHFPDARFVAFAIDGAAPALILLNAHFEPLSITVPAATGIARWRMEIDTTRSEWRRQRRADAGRYLRSAGARAAHAAGRRRAGNGLGAMKRTHRMAFGATPQSDGTIVSSLRAESAPGRPAARGPRSRDDTRRRMVRADGRRGQARHALSVCHRWRAGRARSGLALPAARRQRAERDRRAGSFRLDGRGLARPAVARGGDLRASPRHFHARGHLSRDDGRTRASARPRHHRDRANAARRFRRHAELGL